MGLMPFGNSILILFGGEEEAFFFPTFGSFGFLNTFKDDNVHLL